MKTLLIFPALIILFSCDKKVEEHTPSNKALAIYKQYSSYTDPGEYAYLFDTLPESSCSKK